MGWINRGFKALRLSRYGLRGTATPNSQCLRITAFLLLVRIVRAGQLDRPSRPRSEESFARDTSYNSNNIPVLVQNVFNSNPYGPTTKVRGPSPGYFCHPARGQHRSCLGRSGWWPSVHGLDVSRADARHAELLTEVNGTRYPLITLSTRAQVESKRAHSTTYDAVRRIVQREGITGLYAGLDSALFGISVTNFVYYYCETLSKKCCHGTSS